MAKSGTARRSPLWARLLTVFGAVLIVAGAGSFVTIRYLLNQLTSNVQTTSSVLDTPEVSSTETKAGELPSGAMNLLMLGLDSRAGWEEEGIATRSDTILVLHITAARDRAFMISIPRDTIAKIPADKSMGFNGATDKINSAYAYGSADGRGWEGGAKLATKAVHELTDIEFDGVMVIDFEGFKGILEALGGVQLCVDKDMWSSHYVVNNGKVEYAKGADPTSPPSNALWFKKGCREMEPWEALEFSRLRHSANGDYDRQRHQQQLLRAIAAKAASAGVLGNPTKVSNLLTAAGKSLKMDTHGVPVENFILGLKSVAAADLIPIRTNGGTFAGVDGGEGVTEETRALFAATSKDRLPEFLMDHSEMVISEDSASS